MVWTTMDSCIPNDRRGVPCYRSDYKRNSGWKYGAQETSFCQKPPWLIPRIDIERNFKPSTPQISLNRWRSVSLFPGYTSKIDIPKDKSSGIIMSDLSNRNRKLDSSDSTRRLINEPYYPSTRPNLPMVHDGIILSLNSGQKSYIYLSGESVPTGTAETEKNTSIVQVTDILDKQEAEGSVVSSSNNSSYFTHSTLKLLSNRRHIGSKEVNSFAEYDPPGNAWGSRVTYFLSFLGIATGLANLWRFPTLTYTYGPEFVLAYLILYIISGPALCVIELACGQFSSAGPSKIWKCLPIFSGVGGGQLILGFYMLIVYFVLTSIATVYLIDGFYNHIPWGSCEWVVEGVTCCEAGNSTLFNHACADGGNKIIAPEQYFSQIILGDWSVANSNDRLWMYTSSTSVVLAILIFSSLQGIRLTGIISNITAVVTLLLLTFFTVIGGLRENALDGFTCLRQLQWTKMGNSEIWFAAATQVILSMSLSCGNLITYGSYNNFKNNFVRDYGVLYLLNFTVTVLSGCAYFLHLGATASKYGSSQTVCDLLQRDKTLYLGVPFIIYSDLVAQSGIPALQIGGGKLLLALFPIMFIMSGLSVMCGLVHSCLHTVKVFFRIKYRNMSLIVVLVSLWSCSMVFLVKDGFHLFYLLDFYGFSAGSLLFTSFYLFGYTVLYGIKNWYRDLKFMVSTSLWGIPIVWTILPFVSMALLIWQLMNPYYFIRLLDGLKWEFPVAVTVMCIPLLLVFVKAVIQVYRQVDYGIIDKIKQASRPSLDWGPKDLRIRHEWLKLRHNTGLGYSWQESVIRAQSLEHRERETALKNN